MFRRCRFATPIFLPRVVVLAGPGLLAGCELLRTPDPPALVAPELAVVATPFAGTGLTGPLDAPASTEHAVPMSEHAEPTMVRCRGLWLERAPVVSGTLEAEAALVLATGSAEPIRPRAERARGIGVSRGEEATDLLARAVHGDLLRISHAFEEVCELEPGQTFQVRAETYDPSEYAFAIEVDRRTADPDARVLVELGPLGAPKREQLALRDALSRNGGPLALVFPRVPALDQPAALLVVLEVVDAEEARASDAAWNEIAPTFDRLSPALSRAELESREVERAMSGLGNARERRAALILLASDCGAPLLLDAALVAQDAELEALAVAASASVEGERRDRATTGWLVERSAWLHLAKLSGDEKIAPELSGILARHGGEAVRFHGAIEDIVRGIDGRAALDARLVEENRILLEAASPASRVRAFDWLAVRGLAPAGYDPLGSLSERRAALEVLEPAESTEYAEPAETAETAADGEEDPR